MENHRSAIEQALSIRSRNIAILAYLTVVGLLISIIMNNSRRAAFSSYHVQQSFGLTICGLILGMVGIIPSMGSILAIMASLPLFYMWISGLANAINGKARPVPILGEKFENVFRNSSI